MPPFLASCFLALVSASAQDGAQAHSQAEPETQPGYSLELPPGPAARAWAGVGPRTQPAPLAPDLAELAANGAAPWTQPATWTLWAERLDQVRQRRAATARPGAPRDDALASARADLAMLAGAHGRDSDAWSHFAALTDAPAHAARVAPHLIPGVPWHAPLTAGGAPAPLVDGTLLTPVLPEYLADDPHQELAWRSAQVRGLPVAGSRVDVLLSTETSGVELSFQLLAGPSVELRGLLPEPRNYGIRYEYLNWEKVPKLRTPTLVRLIPGEEEPHVLYGRFNQAFVPWPAGRPGHLTSSLTDAGVWLVLEPDDPDQALWSAAAGACGRLLDVPAGLRAPALPGRPGLELEVPFAEVEGPSSRAAFGRYLASALEAHVLHTP